MSHLSEAIKMWRADGPSDAVEWVGLPIDSHMKALAAGNYMRCPPVMAERAPPGTVLHYSPLPWEKAVFCTPAGAVFAQGYDDDSVEGYSLLMLARVTAEARAERPDLDLPEFRAFPLRVSPSEAGIGISQMLKLDSKSNSLDEHYARQRARLFRHLDDRKLEQVFAHWFFDVVHTINLLNCANISLAPLHKGNKARKRKKKTKARGIAYRVLMIGKGQERRRLSPSNREREGVRQHVRRGHFRDYSKGSGLFGSLNKRIWVPSHLCGEKERGQIHKAYKVDDDA